MEFLKTSEIAEEISVNVLPSQGTHILFSFYINFSGRWGQRENIPALRRFQIRKYVGRILSV